MAGESHNYEILNLEVPDTLVDDVIADALDKFQESVLEVFLEDENSFSAGSIAVIQAPQKNGTTKLAIFMIDDTFDRGRDGGAEIHPCHLEQIVRTEREVGGKMTHVILTTESVVGKTDGTATRGVFFGSQDMNGAVDTHIYLRNEPDDPSGFFREFTDAPAILSNATKHIVGLFWKDYLTARAINQP